MATQTGPVKFKGKLGPLIGYYRNGKYVLRSRPEQVRQTSATKRSAGEFGITSRKGRLIRRAIVPHLITRYDGSLGNRLNRVLVKAGGTDVTSGKHLQAGAIPKHPAHFTHRLEALTGFQFNPHTSLRQILAMDPVYSQDGTVHLQPQLLRMPQKASHLQIRATGVRINFAERRVVAAQSVTAIIDPHTPFNGLDLSLAVPGKGPLFIILQLRAGIMHKDVFLPMGDKRYMAADIIAVALPASAWHQRSRKAIRERNVHRSSFTRVPLQQGTKPQHIETCTFQLLFPLFLNDHIEEPQLE